MPKKPQAPSPHHKLSSYKKFWIIFTSSILLIIGILLGTSLYETYHDRPLAKGLDYIGRDYNSGCLPFRILCTGPESEFLFYATNVKPEDVAGLFPGWKLEGKGESLWYLPQVQVDILVFSLVSNDGTRLVAAYDYFSDKDPAIRQLNLLPSDKKYLIMVDSEKYKILHQAASE